jgi:hypothetical protein
MNRKKVLDLGKYTTPNGEGLNALPILFCQIYVFARVFLVLSDTCPDTARQGRCGAGKQSTIVQEIASSVRSPSSHRLGDNL